DSGAIGQPGVSPIGTRPQTWPVDSWAGTVVTAPVEDQAGTVAASPVEGRATTVAASLVGDGPADHRESDVVEPSDAAEASDTAEADDHAAPDVPVDLLTTLTGVLD